MSFEEAEKKLEDLKLKMNAYVLEKEANKRNALNKWRRLPVTRIRLHRIEQRLLDAESFGGNLKALGHIDAIRNMANEASTNLREVYDYYYFMDNNLQEVNDMLKDIEDKLASKAVKEGKTRRPKCLWFLCF
ncbi:unnamed protein product [Gongylonema pulchrum]|uniref:Rx_N domain-containing protein n=1 Tax=Gongylonema pulchrum TaxID=637853 RepID=A0A183D666_9BILA|nr:unnamed protein product [Gongylonema pulchrum]